MEAILRGQAAATWPAVDALIGTMAFCRSFDLDASRGTLPMSFPIKLAIADSPVPPAGC
jgi:hypothetical protein